MGTSTFGSNPGGWSSWVQSGVNTYNVIHQGSDWTAPSVGRFLTLYGFFSGYTAAVNAQLNAWQGGGQASPYALYCNSGIFAVGAGSASAGGQAWQSASPTGTNWIGGPFPGAFQFGWGRDPAGDHVFSTQPDGGHYFGDTNTSGYSVASISGSTAAPMGSDGSVGAYAVMQNLTIRVRRGGAWAPALVRARRAGVWGYYPIYVRRSGTWVPVQRLDSPAVQVRRANGWRRVWDAMTDAGDPFFDLGASADLNVDDMTGRMLVNGEWCPMQLQLRHDVVSVFGTDRQQWDRRVADQNRLTLAA